jgi:hypothetical protein
MHLSRSTFQNMTMVGLWKLPTTLHITYCGQKVSAGDVGPEPVVDCDECISSLMWEEIDRFADQLV